MDTEDSVECLHRYLYCTHDCAVLSEEREVYTYVVELLSPAPQEDDREEDREEDEEESRRSNDRWEERKGGESKGGGGGSSSDHVRAVSEGAARPSVSASSRGTVSRIIALDVLVLLIGPDSESLIHATTVLKMSSNETR